MQRESSKLNLLKKYSEELGPGFEVKDGTMFCKFCKATLLVQKKSQIMQHVRTKKHQHHIQVSLKFEKDFVLKFINFVIVFLLLIRTFNNICLWERVLKKNLNKI